MNALKETTPKANFPARQRRTYVSSFVPEQQLQLSVQESNQRPSADDFSVAVAERQVAVALTVQVQTLGPRGQRHNLGRSQVEPWRERRRQKNEQRETEDKDEEERLVGITDTEEGTTAQIFGDSLSKRSTA